MQLIAENLSLERGGRRIVSGLSFSVSAGEALLLTGPNGAGKSTLLRALSGFLLPEEGVVRLTYTGRADAEAQPEETEIAAQCHFIGHRDGVKGGLSVLENARFVSRYLGDGAEPWVALERFGLDALADVPAAYLSAGQRRRLGLTRLLLSQRPLWLLDEPSVSLDAAGVTTLAEIIKQHLAGGGLAIAATHVPLGLDGARVLRLEAAAQSSPTGEDARA